MGRKRNNPLTLNDLLQIKQAMLQQNASPPFELTLNATTMAQLNDDLMRIGLLTEPMESADAIKFPLIVGGLRIKVQDDHAFKETDRRIRT